MDKKRQRTKQFQPFSQLLQAIQASGNNYNFYLWYYLLMGQPGNNLFAIREQQFGLQEDKEGLPDSGPKRDLPATLTFVYLPESPVTWLLLECRHAVLSEIARCKSTIWSTGTKARCERKKTCPPRTL